MRTHKTSRKPFAGLTSIAITMMVRAITVASMEHKQRHGRRMTSLVRLAILTSSSSALAFAGALGTTFFGIACDGWAIADAGESSATESVNFAGSLADMDVEMCAQSLRSPSR
jgi:hypothetical protein